MSVFVDTSAFYALADESDRNHRRAKAAYEMLIGDRLSTSDHVLVECWFLLGSRLGRDAAIRFWDALRAGIVAVVDVTHDDLERAREILARFPDQTFSLVDATSFAVMEREEIVRAFAFDAHYGIYRFGEENRRRFDVVP
ncbi:MAG: PIN domain-containing protein [Candidatus Bipolaricaulota bacterium]|nr:PIN domain-containing protein [Candidatus Bipolaricaulota bacterium]